jgi:hypothetical protein
MNSFLGKMRNAADKATSSASSTQEKVMQEYLPKIVIILKEKAGPALVEIISDLERLSQLARTAYQALPMPVRLIVKEQSFIDWILAHQDKILDIVNSQLTSSDQSTSPDEVTLLLKAD